MSEDRRFPLPALIVQRWGHRFYYGWAMAAAAAVGMFFTAPGQTFTISVILNALIEEFDLSRTAISSAYSLGTVTAAFGLPYLGSRIDRYGPRTMIAVVYGCLGVLCLLFPLAGGLAALYFFFTGLRFFGQGSGMLVSLNLAAQWFDKRRGTAMTVAMVGGSLSSALVPPLLQVVVNLTGWRTGYLLLGGLTLAVMLPLALLLVADRPESLGLRPDGAPPRAKAPRAGAEGAEQADAADGAAPEEEEAEEVAWTRAEALRTAAFWCVAFAMAVPAGLMTGMMFHQISFFEEQGLSSTTAAGIFTVFSIAMFCTTLVFGPLLDRLPTRYMVTVGLFVLPVTMWFMLVTTSPERAVVYGVLLGISAGTYFPAANYVWPRYFGRKHLGGIQGVANTINVVGAAIGPLPFGVAYDLLGGYHEAVLVQSAIPLSFALLLLFIGPPRRSVPARTADTPGPA